MEICTPCDENVPESNPVDRKGDYGDSCLLGPPKNLGNKCRFFVCN